MGVLSALPIVSAGNLCCCLWLLSGGAVAAYLLQQNHPLPITPGDGALVGLLAGLIGATVYFVLSIPIGILMAPLEREVLQRIVDMAGPMPPDMREMIERYSGRTETSVAVVVIYRVVAFMFMLVLGAIFSTLGGLVGAAIFRKPASPPGTIDVPPGA
jgi:hypothetical protein